jgi:rSAM/selenodomain-associated transferase 1
VKVVAVMTRAAAAVATPSPADALVVDLPSGPKTRLAPVLPDPAHRAALHRAMVTDVLAAARGVPGALVRVAVTPAGSPPEAFADFGIAPAHVIDQKGDDLGARERALFHDLFRRGARQVVIVGSDLPLLTSDLIADAFDALSADPGQVVLGPAYDGGYYLLGLAGPKVPDLFTGVRWSTRYTLMDTLRRCEFESRRVTFLPLLHDVDEPGDLTRLAEHLASTPQAAPHTAAALAALGLTR